MSDDLVPRKRAGNADRERVAATLPCGHVQRMACRVDVRAVLTFSLWCPRRRLSSDRWADSRARRSIQLTASALRRAAKHVAAPTP